MFHCILLERRWNANEIMINSENKILFLLGNPIFVLPLRESLFFFSANIFQSNNDAIFWKFFIFLTKGGFVSYSRMTMCCMQFTEHSRAPNITSKPTPIKTLPCHRSRSFLFVYHSAFWMVKKAALWHKNNSLCRNGQSDEKLCKVRSTFVRSLTTRFPSALATCTRALSSGCSNSLCSCHIKFL